MPDHHFCFIYDKNKQLDYTEDEDKLVNELLKKFADDRKKKPEDYAFYYKGSLLKIDNSLRVKDSIFAQYEGKTINIIAMLLTGPISSPTEEEGKEPQKGQDKNEIQNEPQKNKENEVKDTNEEEPVRRKRINKMYYNDIICPKCKTSAIIDKNKGELNLNILNCENFHCLNNIKYDMFDDFVFDFDDQSEESLNKLIPCQDLLICNKCGEHKKNLTPPNDQMYICSCGSNVCPECNLNHNDPGHVKTNIDDKNYYCLKHGDKFSSYCFDCNANFCEKCEADHKAHETEKFSKIKPKREEVRELENKIDDQKEKLLDFIETTRKLFDDIINTVESYLNSYIMIEKGLIRRFNRQELNYQLIRNLKNKKLFENDIFQKLENLDKIEEINKRFISLFNDIYKPINDAKQKKDKKDKKNQTQIIQIPDNSMKITYNIGGKKFDRRVKLFDPVFVENNKDKLSLKIEGEKQDGQKKEEKQKELRVYFNNADDYKNLTVTLSQIGKDPITDMSYMFNNCKYLHDVDFKDWKTDNITSMEAMFQLCNLEKIPDISKFNTTNLENIRAMFCKCTKIIKIPNMNIWFNNKKNNLTNMSMLFNGCIALKGKMTNKFNDTTKLKDISGMFSGCTQLKEFTIGIYNTFNVTNMTGLFKNCSGLEVMPDLSKWSMMKVEKYKGMFYGCKKLNQPKWLPLLKFKKGTNYDQILENSNLNQELKNSWKNNEPKDEIN